MIDIDRIWEKLYPAAWKLARSADPIHDRIGEAYRGFRDLKGEAFPPESRILYNSITARMTAAGPVVDNNVIKTGRRRQHPRLDGRRRRLRGRRTHLRTLRPSRRSPLRALTHANPEVIC